jgi:hypothetical protein
MARKNNKEQESLDLSVEDQNETENILIDEPDAADEVVILEGSEGGDPVEDSIEELRSKLKDTKQKYNQEKKARQEAENAAQQATQQAYKASAEVEENQIHLVSGALETLRREQEMLKHTMKEVMAVGDFDRAVELQESFQSNINKITRLEDGLNEMKNSPRREAPPAPSRDLVDTLIQQVTPRSAKWLDSNREHLQDTRMLRIMERAHGDALDNQIIPESDDYFRFIENRLGIGKTKEAPRNSRYDDDDEVMSGASNSTNRRQSAPAAAPVSRSSGGPTGNPRVIRLTPDQAEAARISGISPKEYWENLQAEKTRNTSH